MCGLRLIGLQQKFTWVSKKSARTNRKCVNDSYRTVSHALTYTKQWTLIRYTLEAFSYCPCVTRGSHSHPRTNHIILPLLPSRKASPPFGWYSLRLPTNGWPGWVDLGGWLHIEIDVPHCKLNPDTVTHPSTNRAGRRLTSLVETCSAPPIRQTTTLRVVVNSTRLF